MVLCHLAVEGHPGPLEFLGGLALVPLGGKQDGKDPVPFLFRKPFCFLESPLKRLGQVHDADLPGGEVDEGGLQDVLQLAHIAGPIIAE